MKAMVNMKYGPPDVLELTEVERPTPKDDEALLKVHAASVNPADWHLLRGDPYIARLQLGLRHPKTRVLGCDVAGRVEAVGKNVTTLQPGDEVSVARSCTDSAHSPSACVFQKTYWHRNRPTSRSSKRRQYPWPPLLPCKVYATTGGSNQGTGC